jgi:hypothetical protein
MCLDYAFTIEVVKVHNNTMIVARLQDTKALLRFRFMRPLDVKVVVPGCRLTILKCQFSLVTKMINCLEVEQNIFKVSRRCVFSLDE